jgi:nitrogen regulatory protein PII
MDVNKHELIITIVNKGYSGDVIDSAKKAGAFGGTILHGRGSGINESTSFFNIIIEPEKEIIITIVEKSLTTSVLECICKDLKLETPGNGIAFSIEISKAVGLGIIGKPK